MVRAYIYERGWKGILICLQEQFILTQESFEDILVTWSKPIDANEIKRTSLCYTCLTRNDLVFFPKVAKSSNVFNVFLQNLTKESSKFKHGLVDILWKVFLIFFSHHLIVCHGIVASWLPDLSWWRIQWLSICRKR